MRTSPGVFQAAIAVAALACSLTGAASAQCHFLEFTYESNDNTPATDPGIPFVADFNRDGKLDAVWPNSATNNITVALGDGLGDFSSTTNIPVGSFPARILGADFNRDGRLDLTVSGFSSVLLGNGSGGFTPGPTISLFSSAAGISDFNRDGILDLFGLNANSFRLFIGDGTGQFASQPTIPTDGQNARAFVGDLNRDGRDDVVISQNIAGRVAVFLANATGFGTQTNFGIGTNVHTVLLADINNDEKLDLLVGRNSGTTDVAVLLGDGAGGFGPVTQYETGFSPQSLAVGDFNGDGKTDLVTGSESSGTPSVEVLANNGDGTFAPSKRFFTGGGPHNVAVGDFNNDGKDDIFATEQNQDTFGVLRNSCSGRAEVEPDFTGDNKADIAIFRPSTGFWFVLRSEDFAFFSFPFGANGDIPAAADYDGDDLTDAAVYRPSIGSWFIRRSTGGTVITQFGNNTDLPVPNDYDGDGRADVAIYRPGNGEWWVQRSTSGLMALQFGAPGDIAIR